MKLYNAYYICKNSIQILQNFQVEERRLPNKNDITYALKNWEEIVKSLEVISGIDYLEKSVDQVYLSVPPLLRTRNAPVVSASVKNEVVNHIEILRCKVQVIIDLYETIDEKEKKLGVDIKIPKCDSLDEYIECLKDINFVFTQCPYLINKESGLEFRGTDVGSIWLTFAIIGTGTLILKNIAKLIDSAVKIKSHLTTYKQQEEMLTAMRQKNEIGDEIIKVFEKMKSQCLQECAESVEADLGELKDGEEQGKLKKSLEKLAILLDKGVQIYSSIEAPKEIQALFPEVEENVAISEKISGFLEKKTE